MQTTRLNERVTLAAVDSQHQADDFSVAVHAGLTRNPKTVPSRFLYDEIGSDLFEQICELPEYYVTRTELQILENHADDLFELLPRGLTLVELGSGSSTKTRVLIEAILRQERELRYVPIDISKSAVEQSSLALADVYSDLLVDGVVGEYREGLSHVQKAAHSGRLILWLGSSIGNFERHDATSFLSDLRRRMSPVDYLLIGIDLRKSAEILKPAYDDAAGVTASFNLNLLDRMNRELSSQFDRSTFSHSARYNADMGRIEMHLVSQIQQRVRIDSINSEVSFSAGESIHTENSHKFSQDEIASTVASSGFEKKAQWVDERGFFSVNLLGTV